jgi:hypothetical protein
MAVLNPPDENWLLPNEGGSCSESEHCEQKLKHRSSEKARLGKYVD